jgi:Ankyrin repeats (3 copies)
MEFMCTSLNRLIAFVFAISLIGCTLNPGLKLSNAGNYPAARAAFEAQGKISGGVAVNLWQSAVFPKGCKESNEEALSLIPIIDKNADYLSNSENQRRAQFQPKIDKCKTIALENNQVNALLWLVNNRYLPKDFVNQYSPIVFTSDDVPLETAIGRGNAEVATYLLDMGALPFAWKGKIGENGYFALNQAASLGLDDIVDLLLSRGVDPNIHLYGKTPLVAAIENGKLETAKHLIARGAFISYADIKIQDPVIVARSHGHQQFATYLVSLGAVDKMKITDLERQRATERSQESLRRFVSSVGDLVNTAIGIAVVGTMMYYSHEVGPTTTNNYTTYQSPSENRNVSQVIQPQPSTRSGCTSDFSCTFGSVCVKPPLEVTGICMQTVNKNSVVIYSQPSNDSIYINTNPSGSCTFNTDCPASFQCDPKLKACIK